jgi:glucose/mannose transport system substrate-binding protein
MKFEKEISITNPALMRRRGLRALACIVLSGQGAQLRAQPSARLQVLHWWTSKSEAKAIAVLEQALGRQHIVWQDVAIPGAVGFVAGKVLKNRMLAGNAPDVAQLNGVGLAEWAALGLLQQIDGIAKRDGWAGKLYPAVWQLVRQGPHVVAAPLGIHRINLLFFNRDLFARLGLTPPVSWAEFEIVAARCKQAGVTPLAQSSEPWQVATLFESLILAQGGPDYYHALFVANDQAAFADERLTRALQHLRALKPWMGPALSDEPWQDSVRRVGEGSAAMHIGGDWGKGELNAQGFAINDRFGVQAVPGTSGYHLYCVDTLAMLLGHGKNRAAQQKLAAMILQPGLQLALSQVKGSIPVLAAATPSALAGQDSCARESARVFALGARAQVPSLVHRMATDDATRDAIIAELHRFFIDDRVVPGKTRQRLAEIVHALRRIGSDHVRNEEKIYG